jgi:hypothetical protein
MIVDAHRNLRGKLLTDFNEIKEAEETVNQPSYDFEGSSPSSPTILFSLKN